MRIIIFLILISFSIQPAFSQVPSKKEMQEQMAAATNELKTQITELEKQLAEAKKNKEDPEAIKDLDDQLKMLKKQVDMMSGLNKNISNVSDETYNAAVQEKKTEGVPKRDDARIKSLPLKILSDAELVTYFKNVTVEVGKKISTEDKKEAEELYAGINPKENNSKVLANAANACWMNGQPEVAMYLMGKACLNDMSNGNNLNNYASFLIMEGGDHVALPILQNLNIKYPDNSTILNNIGQAWYGLGDMNNANKFLDQVMRLYGIHSQANLTKSKIQKSQGKKKEAAESIKKSIKENYTAEKEAELNDLGGKLEFEDIPFRHHAKADPLGIEKFMNIIPPYPFEGGVTAEKSRMEWEDFKKKVWAARDNLSGEKERVKQKVDAYTKKLFDNPQILKPYNNSLYKTYARKLVLLHDWYRDRFIAVSKKIDAAGDSVAKWRDEMNSAYRALGDHPSCEASKSIATNFISKSNLLWQQRNAELLSLQKQMLNAEARCSLYGTHDRCLYEQAIVNIKESFLMFLGGLNCEFEIGCIPAEVEKQPGKVLPDFDEMNCTSRDEIFIPPFTTMKFECNKMTTSVNITPPFNYREGVSPYVKFQMEENINTGKITKGTLEVGGEIGVSDGKQEGIILGPIRAEAKVEGGVGVEFTEEGIETVYVKVESKSDIGPYTTDSHGHTAAEGNYVKEIAAVETEVSWNVGSEKVHGGLGEAKFEGKGLLSGIHISTGGAH